MKDEKFESDNTKNVFIVIAVVMFIVIAALTVRAVERFEDNPEPYVYNAGIQQKSPPKGVEQLVITHCLDIYDQTVEQRIRRSLHQFKARGDVNRPLYVRVNCSGNETASHYWLSRAEKMYNQMKNESGYR